MKKVFPIFALFIIAALLFPAQRVYGQGGDDIQFERLTIDDGLSQSSVFAIVQDKRGLMWFGTWDGLNKYDGYRFTVYKYDPENPGSLSDNEIRALYEDSHGILWVGTMDGLNRFDREKESFIRYRNDPDNPASLGGTKVHAITEDKNGTLWIGTEEGGLNKFDRASGQFFNYQHHPDDPYSLSSNDVRAIFIDSQGIFWIGTWGGGLNRFDPHTERFESYRHNPNDPTSLADDFVRSVYQDRSGNLWVGTESGGLGRFDQKSKQFTNYLPDPDNPRSLSDKEVLSIYETGAGELWIGTYGGGLNKFNKNTHQFSHYHPVDGSNVWSIYQDRSGTLWVGTAEGGVNKVPPKLKNFKHVYHNPEDPNSLSGNDVWSIFEDRDGVLWVGVWDYGLNRYDSQSGSFKHYMPNPDDPNSLSQKDVMEITQDHEGMLWIGTAEGGVNRFNPQTEQFTRYLYDPNDPHSLAHNAVFSILEDRQRRLWVGSYFGKSLSLFNRKDETFSNFTYSPDNPDGMGDYKIGKLYEDSKGNFWMSTNGGGLGRYDRQSQKFTYYTHNPADPHSVSHNFTTDIHQDRSGALWVGTWGGGLNRFDPKTETFTAYKKEDGLPSNSVMGILEDNAGNLWLSTFRGLSRFNPAEGTFKNYTPKDGVQSNEFNSTVAFKGHDGQLYFGGINGFNAFYPQEIKDNPNVPPIILTDFQIFNKSVPIGKDSVLKKSIAETDEITLSYKESVFSFEFSALDYTFSEKNRYRYKLEGLEDNWNEVDSKRRFATYTNLDPGEYIFRVTGSNNDGIWNEEGTSIKIIVTPPWWETIWFRGGLIIGLIGLVAGVFYKQRRDAKKREEYLEIVVKERTHDLATSNKALQTANRAKSVFLSNMSHELRTPLNGILGYAQILKREPSLSPKQLDGLNIIHDSGQHLLTLINDILDIAKVEAGKLELYPTPVRLPDLLTSVVNIIKMAAREKALKFVYEAAPDLPEVVKADKKRLRQILLNLLGNAVKFTDEGQVLLRVETRKPKSKTRGRNETSSLISLHFSVTDTGVGITADQLQKIFTPFEQAGDAEQKQQGAGLGLAISRQLVNLMGGELQVKSEPGKGSTFTFEITVPVPDKTTLKELDKEKQRIIAYQGQRRHILVVDGHAENRLVLQNLLEPLGFKITLAVNGQEGVEMAQKTKPDLILMDLVMPVMTGFEAIKILRNRPGTKNTPIIAISANVFDMNREKSRLVGCNDFLPKPVEADKLFDLLEKHLNLNWIYDKALIETVAPLAQTKIIPPPQQELEQLYKLTMYGNMERVLEEIKLLEETDGKYSAFARKVRTYAQKFEDEPILKLLEQLMTQKNTGD